MTHPIPDSALDDRLGFTGTAGSGKTYNAGSAVERVLNRSGRVIIPDPLGVWWGLRLNKDGRTASVFDVVIFGGPHGDLPLNEHAGALIGETVAGMRESCILDLSELGTKAAERRFMLAFLTALYRKATGEPVHVVFDEADMWAPQKLLDRDGDAAKLLGMMETIVRRGRIKGFIPWLITQRPAVLSKDVLSQVDGLVAFKLTSSQDRDALEGWIEGQAEKGQWKEIRATLPTMQLGQGVVWVPGRGIFATRQFPEKLTFDSSRTPRRGEKKRSAELKPLDLPQLKDRLAAVEAEVKANDPARLKKEIADLRRQVAAKAGETPVMDPQEIERAERRGYERGFSEGAQAAKDVLLPKAKAVSDAADALRHTALPVPLYRPQPIITRQASQAQPRPSSPPRHTNGASAPLPPGERAVLVAAAQYGGVDRDQLSVLTGYKRSSRDAYIQRLREKGFVEVSGQTVAPTDAGRGALGDGYQPLPTGTALQDYWSARLPEGERKILGALIKAYPNTLHRYTLDDATGYKRSSRDAYIQRLKSRRLVTTHGPEIRASETLF